MSYKNLQGFKIKDYKCFVRDNDYQGFDSIKPINIVIGKNNSGKSKILEFLKVFVEANKSTRTLKMERNIAIRKKLEEAELRSVFRLELSGGEYGHLCINFHDNHWRGIGEKLLGKVICYSDEKIEIEDHPFIFNNIHKERAYEKCCKELAAQLFNPFLGYNYLSIQAERDLKKEAVNFNNDPGKWVLPDGTRLTELIVRCLNEEKGHDEDWQNLVEGLLLDKINSVLFPDIAFSRIYTKIDTNNTWEIFLEEKNKGGIRLSDSGSGIKTIILVMTMLYLVPEFCTQDKFVFAFEELENNLHPSLERRLLAHIRSYIENNPDNLLFITTHSNVAIDMFSGNPNAQILRVFNDGKATFIETADKWNDHHNLLNDLGVKASDVLQANCIIWLEGPSDRIYFNKWIELFNEGEKLEEDLHYQCAFYGGSILSHFTADPEQDDFIQMLRINRNAIILMDRDKPNSTSPLKERVQRILREAENRPSVLAWVTEGREMENYLTKEILEQYFEEPIAFTKYISFSDVFKRIKQVESFDKVKFAADITNTDYYTRQALEDYLDLNTKMLAVIEHIRLCNT